MPRARQHLVNVNDTAYYHVTSRCVRRAFLCGTDRLTKTCYDHRKDWLEQRIRLLSSVFAIDLCAYAVMSNHYHIVLTLVPKSAEPWTMIDVIRRWCSLYKGTLLVQKYRKGGALTPLEYETLTQTVSIYRERLTNLSWFMKCLNEPIARRANSEDKCTGHFWESRFSSQALPTDTALLAAMVYVDLNPVRAMVADMPETSAHTSIKERLMPSFSLQEAIREQLTSSDTDKPRIKSKALVPFKDQAPESESQITTALPFALNDYLELLDVTGRMSRPDKPGVIAKYQPPILQRLSLPLSNWERYSTQFELLHRRGVFRRSMG